jgi:nucleotide-binding universal stress UspA family protein
MSKRWLIGLSLATDELGPLELGAWLHHATGAPLQVLHVAEVPSLPKRYRDELEAGLRQMIDQQVAEAGLANQISAPEVSLGRNVARELVERAAALDAGLLIGRAAPRSATAIVRLGRVARRVLRSLPGVVGIVPPDLGRRDIGEGPVLLAIARSGNADASVAFARELAGRLGRELVVAHVFDAFADAAVRTRPPELARRYRLAWQEDARAELDEVVRRQELAGARVLTREGSACDELLAAAAEEGASFIVCGSRRLSVAERVFEGSTGSILAATADVPVFVVPSNA